MIYCLFFRMLSNFYYNISSPFSSYHNISTLWTIVIGRFMGPFAVLMINLLPFIFESLWWLFIFNSFLCLILQSLRVTLARIKMSEFVEKCPAQPMERHAFERCWMRSSCILSGRRTFSLISTFFNRRARNASKMSLTFTLSHFNSKNMSYEV